MRLALVRLSSIGDVVHTLPLASRLRAELPDARIAWIVGARQAPLVTGHPAVDEVVVVEERRGHPWARAGGFLAAGRRLATGRWDVAIDAQGLVKSGLLAWLTRAPVRVGFAAAACREPLSAVFTNRRVRPDGSVRHVVDRNLALLSGLGCRPRPGEFDLPWDREADARVATWAARTGVRARERLVVLAIGAAHRDKRWPVAAFAGLARELGHAGATQVVVVWGPGEIEDARAAVAGAPGALLAPATTLAELLCVLRRASVVVAADTGTLHLAAAAGVPCVGLYGPTSEERNGPYGATHHAVAAVTRQVADIPVGPVRDAVLARLP